MTLSQGKISQTRMSDILLLLILTWAPFFRGLYYEQQMLVFQTAVFVSFILFLSKNRTLKISHPLDFSAAALAVGYLLSIPGAADPREALLAFMRMLAYFMIYLMVSVRAGEKNFRSRLLVAVYMSGIVSAAGTLLNLFGIIETANVWESGIIQTTLEYKNTGALFLLACTLIGVYLAGNPANQKYRILMGCGNFLSFLLLLGTQSRAVWVLSLLGFLLVLWGFKGKSLIPTAVHTLITLVPALVLSGPVLQALGRENAGQALALILFGSLLTAAALYCWHRWGSGLTKKQLFYVTGFALLLLIAAGALMMSGSTPLGERMQNIVSFDFNARERTVFFHDAMNIFRQHPLLGTGGKGWDVLYLNSQSYGYYAENVHNDFLQIAVEAGLVGLLPYMALWMVFLGRCFRLSRCGSDSDQKQTVYLLLGIGTTAFLHSLLDFDLAHGALAFILWMVFGLARSSCNWPESTSGITCHKPGVSFKLPVYAFVLVGGILYSLISLSFVTGDIFFAQGENTLQSGNLAGARTDFEKALSFDPWKANTLTSLAQINLAIFQNSGDRGALDDALQYAARSAAVRPSEPLTHSVYSTALFFKGDFPGAVREAESFVKLHPMLTAAYEQLAYTNLISGIQLAKRSDMNTAKSYFANTLEVIDLVNARLKTISPYHLEMWKINQAEPVLSVSPIINIYAGIAGLCLGDHQQAGQLISTGIKEGPSPDVQIWKPLELKLQGKEEESRALLQKASTQDPGFVQFYNEIMAISNR